MLPISFIPPMEIHQLSHGDIIEKYMCVDVKPAAPAVWEMMLPELARLRDERVKLYLSIADVSIYLCEFHMRLDIGLSEGIDSQDDAY